MVFFYRDLGNFKDEVEQEDGHVDDFTAHDLEQASEFSCGHIDEVDLFLFSGLFSYELFALDVIVFAEELEELEGASVGGNAELVVKVLIGGVGLEDVFPEAVSLGGVEEVVVVNGGGAEVVFEWLFFLGVFGDVFEDEFAELLDKCLDISEDFIFLIFCELLKHGLLREIVAAQQVRNGA